MTQICAGPVVSSGRTALLHCILAQFTSTGHFCALVDPDDCFDPKDAEAAGVERNRILWIRCGQARTTQQDRAEYKIPKRAANKARRNVENNADKVKKDVENNVTTHDCNMAAEICERFIGRASTEQYKFATDITSNANQENGTQNSAFAEEKSVNAEASQSVHRKKRTAAERSRMSTKTLSSSHRHHMSGVHRVDGIHPRLYRGLNPLEQAFKAADILVQNGGFGLIAVDLSNIDERHVRKVPLTTWFRFARVVKKTQTALVFVMSYPAASICADLTLQMSLDIACWSNKTKQLTDASEQARTNGVVVGPDSIQERPGGINVEDPEMFASNEQLLSVANQPRRELWTGRPLSKDAIAPPQEDLIYESRKRAISPHAHVLEGAECEVEIRREKRPVQPVRPNFTAHSTWK